MGFPIHYSRTLHDVLSLRLLYAADVFVIRSLLYNLPNTGLEAHACATPVVAFCSGGSVDIVDNRISSGLAVPFSTASLADTIRWVMEDPQRKAKLCAAARVRAKRLWGPVVVANLYSEVYKKAHNIITARG